MHTHPRSSLLISVVLVFALAVAACSDASSASVESDVVSETGSEAASDGDGFLDGSVLHDIAVEFDEREYVAMLEAYASTGDKEWIEASVTIDGTTYARVGIRLKGNSSLRGLTAGSGTSSGSSAEALPWLIRLDKYVDGQNHDGIVDIVVRSNTTATALNEAVALDLLERAGLASQDSAYASFTVNDSDAVLRLVMEHPDDVWLDGAFASAGILYKAESTGDYSFRGDDVDAYDEVFDIEAGEDDGDLTPLIEFLDFINNADDETFDAELAERLDVDAFATYLAMQDLIDNFDDIDGPGNNSYLFYDTEAAVFTVVPWDHNLAFGATNGPGAGFDQGGREPGPGADADQRRPPIEGGAVPREMPGGGGDRGGAPGPGGGDNILVERFLANAEWQALYEQKTAALRAELYDSGAAEGILETWVSILETEGGGLVATDTIIDEAATIEAVIDG